VRARSNDFVEEVVQVLHELAGSDRLEAEVRLRRQVDSVNQTATWSIRAKEWHRWLQQDRVAGAIRSVCLAGQLAQKREDFGQ
jgi:hypothetical protein